jgi:MFS family permease
MVGALFVGSLVDRFSSTRLLYVACGCYAVAAAGFATPLGDPHGHAAFPVLVLRAIQGIGSAIALPAALSLVLHQVHESKQGIATSLVASAHNLTLVVITPLSLAAAAVGSVRGVAVVALVSVGLGVFIAQIAFRRLSKALSQGVGIRITFRRRWILPLLALTLSTIYWGVASAYLPQRAYAHGADVGLFFVSDALAVLTLRAPAGWLLDRWKPKPLMLVGLASTLLATVALLQETQNATLVVAGVCAGAGSALVATSVLVLMARRTSPSDRGTGFAFYSLAMAGGLAIGSIGTGPLVEVGGFQAAMLAGAIATFAAGIAVGVDGRRMPVG